MVQRTGRRAPVVVVALAALTALLVLAACKANPRATLISPQLGAMLAAEEAGQIVVALPTPIPPKLADLTPEEIFAGLPADLAEAVQKGDPANGDALTTANACKGCHMMDPANQVVAPTWFNVGDRVITRIPGTGPAEYIHQSIINPNGFLVPGFMANIMPQTYADTFSTQDLGDIIAYLLSLSGAP